MVNKFGYGIALEKYSGCPGILARDAGVELSYKYIYYVIGKNKFTGFGYLCYGTVAATT
jgi:hypothetical protein